MSNEWNYNQATQAVDLDFSLSFDEEVKKIRSSRGGRIMTGSHNYYILRALFEGNTIDDYENPPLNDKGFGIRNIRSRIADLRHDWHIVIGDRVKSDKPYKEYCIQGRGV